MCMDVMSASMFMHQTFCVVRFSVGKALADDLGQHGDCRCVILPHIGG